MVAGRSWWQRPARRVQSRRTPLAQTVKAAALRAAHTLTAVMALAQLPISASVRGRTYLLRSKQEGAADRAWSPPLEQPMNAARKAAVN